MQEYGNQNGNSGIVGFEIGNDYIDVEFKNGGIYRYRETVIGKLAFLNMCAAACIGNGLNAYINQSVRAKAERIRY